SKVQEAYVSTVAVLADAIEAKDAYTRGHCEGVSRIAVEVGRRLGLENEELDAVRYAALLHDVGKIGIPDGILLKPGKLMEEEFSIIQKHSKIGRDLVSRVPALVHLGHVILHHHERFDGSGYPEGLDGENIPLVSRIICIVDAFDAMTTPRPYRDPIERIDAFEEIRRCAGTQFDPRIVEVVTQVLMETYGEN
ncbi:HD-GYP domain-containing protein, partial [bacterium]